MRSLNNNISSVQKANVIKEFGDEIGDLFSKPNFRENFIKEGDRWVYVGKFRPMVNNKTGFSEMALNLLDRKFSLCSSDTCNPQCINSAQKYPNYTGKFKDTCLYWCNIHKETCNKIKSDKHEGYTKSFLDLLGEASTITPLPIQLSINLFLKLNELIEIEKDKTKYNSKLNQLGESNNITQADLKIVMESYPKYIINWEKKVKEIVKLQEHYYNRMNNNNTRPATDTFVNNKIKELYLEIKTKIEELKTEINKKKNKYLPSILSNKKKNQ